MPSSYEKIEFKSVKGESCARASYVIHFFGGVGEHETIEVYDDGYSQLFRLQVNTAAVEKINRDNHILSDRTKILVFIRNFMQDLSPSKWLEGSITRDYFTINCCKSTALGQQRSLSFTLNAVRGNDLMLYYKGEFQKYKLECKRMDIDNDNLRKDYYEVEEKYQALKKKYEELKIVVLKMDGENKRLKKTLNDLQEIMKKSQPPKGYDRKGDGRY